MKSTSKSCHKNNHESFKNNQKTGQETFTSDISSLCIYILITLHSLYEFQDIFKVIDLHPRLQPEDVRRRVCHEWADKCYHLCEPHFKNFDREGSHEPLEWFSNAVFIPGTGSDLTFTSGAHFLKN